MLVGALFWGLTADIMGRKIACNFSLVICSIFAIAAGASPNWEVLGLFVCLSAFGGGGNLVLDTAVFLEYLPSYRQWMLTLMAAWWGLGQLVAGGFAWIFLPNFSCEDPSTVPNAAPCTRANNQGWRYVWYSSGALVFVMSILRITVIRLKETPKFLVGEGRDEECVETLQFIANKYGRPCSLTLEKMQACGTIERGSRTGKSKWGFGEVWMHLKGLYSTRRIGISTTLIWLSWTLIGLAYPLYNVFLPAYLSSRGAAFGQPSAYITWRNYTLVNFSGIWGPVLAGWMCGTKLGRKYTMVVGALVTMAFFFAYTQVRTATQNVSTDVSHSVGKYGGGSAAVLTRQQVAFSCIINFCLNIYYGTLYAYTPEVLPSAHRGTGNGIAIGWNRVMGILSAVIATVADVSSSSPIIHSLRDGMIR
jgi:MFS family permease